MTGVSVTFPADSSQKITAATMYRAKTGNRLEIDSLTLNCSIKKTVTEYNEESGTTISYPTTAGELAVSLVINDKAYTALPPHTGNVYENPAQSLEVLIDEPIVIEANEYFCIGFETYSKSESSGTRSESIDITALLCTSSCPGFELDGNMFSLSFTGMRETMWQYSENEYPFMFGKYDYYSNFNLPYNHKYKQTEYINSGYPWIFRLVSGWVSAYPWEKESAWKSAEVFAKSEGVWKRCSVMMYQKNTAMYKQPEIKTGWKIVQGVNSGYPYVVYNETPFYEEE